MASSPAAAGGGGPSAASAASARSAEQAAIERAIEARVPWHQLPQRARNALGSMQLYLQRHHHSTAQTLPPQSPQSSSSLHSTSSHACVPLGMQVFPYHLSTYICGVLRISPFRFYRDMLVDAMAQGGCSARRARQRV
ncbi:unnamed protein product, partial [Closterium sp. NIES-53]